MEEVLRYFLQPSGAVLLLFCAGVVAVPFRRSRRAAVWLFASAAVTYGVLGAGPVAFALLGSLEYRHAALESPDAANDAAAIVVLAGHAERDPAVPLSAQVNAASAYRILETVRLARALPRAEIIVSGEGAVPRVLGDLLREVGVRGERIVIDDGGQSTRDSALRLRERLGDRRFALVTSAGHMRRAVAVFRKIGMKPIPVPTHYLTKRNVLATAYLPSPAHLRESDLAVQEYSALVWYKLRGWI